MIAVRTAAVATSFIGVLWSLLSLVYHPDDGSFWRDFTTGALVALAGIVIWFGAYLWEDK